MKINLLRAKRSSKNSLLGSIRVGKKQGGIIFWTKSSLMSKFASVIAILLIVFAFLIISVNQFPSVLYRVFPDLSKSLSLILSRPPTSFGDLLTSSGEKQAEYYQPPVDPALSDDNMIVIPKIGVNTTIVEETYENFENALRKGVWHVPDYGTPYIRKNPTILVAHRFGYLEWTNLYRKHNSFYNLPKLEPGDRVQIIWNKRKYEYEIYFGEESEEITDYTADLVLYTCKFLKSPIRIFRYAKLIQPIDT